MIKKFVVTEKSSRLNENNCYTFLVDDEANKVELKKYFKEKYKAEVIKINILKKLGKKVRKGRVTGKTRAYKKAYVFTSQKISEFEDIG